MKHNFLNLLNKQKSHLPNAFRVLSTQSSKVDSLELVQGVALMLLKQVRDHWKS